MTGATRWEGRTIQGLLATGRPELIAYRGPR
jgi:hypothetical protein